MLITREWFLGLEFLFQITRVYPAYIAVWSRRKYLSDAFTHNVARNVILMSLFQGYKNPVLDKNFSTSYVEKYQHFTSTFDKLVS